MFNVASLVLSIFLYNTYCIMITIAFLVISPGIFFVFFFNIRHVRVSEVEYVFPGYLCLKFKKEKQKESKP